MSRWGRRPPAPPTVVAPPVVALGPLTSLRRRGALVAMGWALVILMAWFAVTMVQQSGDLTETVQITAAAAEGDVRALGQVQRELLRLADAITTGAGPEELDLMHGFVSQRIQETARAQLLDPPVNQDPPPVTQLLQARWLETISPQVQDIIAGRSGSGASDLASGAIGELEEEYEELATQGEVNRRRQVREAEETALQLLRRTRLLATGMFLTVALFIGFVAASWRQLERHQRDQARITAAWRRVSQVAERTQSMVLITNAEGNVEWVNDAFTRRTGYPSDALVGRRPHALLHGPETDGAIVADMVAAVRAGRPFSCELINYDADGDPYTVLIQAQPVHDDDGLLTGFISMQTDVTSQRQAETHLREAKAAAEQAAADRQQFLAVMSHEIRTPLTAVIGFTALLLNTGLNEEQRELVGSSNRSGHLLLAVVDDILRYSALESGTVQLERRAVQIRDLVGQTVSVLRREAEVKGLSLDVEIAAAVPVLLEADPTGVQQILVNLVGNAIKFTDDGGVTIRLQPHEDTEVGGPVEGFPLEIVVSDTGIGITRAQVEAVFAPFVQADASMRRRYGGTGLGLAICRFLTRMMDGTIAMRPRPEGGTAVVVRLRLPIAMPPAGVPDAMVAAPVTVAGLHVLVAEDDPVNQRVIELMLRRLGIAADIVPDGQAAVDRVAAADRDGHPYDTVLLDLHMPVLDGLAAAGQIRDSLARPPWLVALTASALNGDRERLLEGGMDDYLSKPVSMDRLTSALRPRHSDHAAEASR